MLDMLNGQRMHLIDYLYNTAEQYILASVEFVSFWISVFLTDKILKNDQRVRSLNVYISRQIIDVCPLFLFIISGVLQK